MATSSLRTPLLGLVALALVAVLALAWRVLDPSSNAAVSPDLVTSSPAARSSVDLVADTLEPEPTRERIVDAAVDGIPPTPPASARAPDLVIRGRVVTEVGRGIADVEVSLPYVNTVNADGAKKNIGSPTKPFARTTSTSDGSFEIALEFPAVGTVARFLLAGRAPGWSPHERWTEVPAGAKTVDAGDVVLTRSAAVHGIVRGVDGAIVEGAVVSARVANADKSWYSKPPSVKSAIDGSFDLRDAPSGEVVLTAHEIARGSSEAVPLTLLPDENRVGIELLLPAKNDAASISGVVLDADGVPLPKASLSASFSEPGSSGGSGMSGMQADEAGRFRIRGREGVIFQVSAAHPRAEARPATLVDVPCGTHGLVLRMTPLASATLRVTSTDGVPVARYAFRVQVKLGTMMTTPTLSKIADRANGEWSMPLPDREFTIEIDAPGFASTSIGPFPAEPNPGLLEARVEALPALRGFVVRGNTPVVGARVRGHRVFEQGEHWQRDGYDLAAEPCDGCPMTKTGVDGSFSLDIGRSGAWRIRADSAGEASALSEPIDVGSRRAQDEVRIDLALRGSIRGHVRSQSGTPLAHRRIGISSGDGEPRDTKTAADGAYAFEGLAPTGYQIRLLADDDGSGSSGTSRTTGDDDAPPIAWDCQVVHGRTTTHDIVVPDPAQLLVTIAVDASALGGAAWVVTASSNAAGASWPDVRATRHGEMYVLQLPVAGPWSIVATVENAGTELTLERRTQVAPGNGVVEFTVAAGSIRGRLRSGAQAGEQVSLSVDTSDGDRVSATTSARADGTFEFPFAVAGSIDLEAKSASEPRRSFHVGPGIVNDVGEL